jgi:hypothetical protein
MAIEDSGFGISSIVVRDNSIRTVTTATTLSILPSLHAVFSSDGKDNVISEETSFNDVLTKYGEDFTDINAYGQQNLLVEQVLESGGTAYICRLLPDDAKTAHLVFKVGVKAVTNIPLYQRDIYGEYKLDDNGNKIPVTVSRTITTTQVNPETQQEEEVTSVEEVPATTSGIKFKVFVQSATEQMLENTNGKPSQLSAVFEKTGSVEDPDGGADYTVIPLFFMYYYGNGKCGKNYGIKIINDFKRDAKVSDGRRYQMFLAKKTSSGAEILSIGNGLSFSFNPYAVVSKTINSIEGLQKIYQNYSGKTQKQIQIDFYQNNYSKLTDLIGEILENDPVLTEGLDSEFELHAPKSVDEVDFINGFDRSGYKYDNVVIADDSTNIGNYQYMEGGSDGSLENATAEDIENIRTSLLKKFYSADIDTSKFMDVLKCDAGITYDANYPAEVKKAMAGMIQWRRDLCGVFDCGFTENLDQAVAVAKSISEFASSIDGGENFAIVPHCGITCDRTVNVRVTGTYEFAYGLHRLYRISPFSIYAGQQNGDAGCVRKTIFDWVIEESKPKGWQEKIARENKLYWAVDLDKALSSVATGNVTERNVYFYSNASLYPETVSKLAEFRNGILVNDIRRVLKLILVKYTFDNDGADSAIEKARAEIVKKFSARYPSNISINVNLYQTERDKLLNMATCEVNVVFPDIFETWSCVITTDRAA